MENIFKLDRLIYSCETKAHAESAMKYVALWEANALKNICGGDGQAVEIRMYAKQCRAYLNGFIFAKS